MNGEKPGLAGFFMWVVKVTLTYTAAEKDKGRTVHSVMRNELSVSATMMRRLKLAGAISVSGVSVFTNYKLAPGEVVEVDIAIAERPCDNLPEHGELDILFENDGLLAVNKPSGILVHPSRSRYTGTLSNFVAGYLGVCHAVNRLDRDTSGVVLFAKNSYVKALASGALSAKEAKKEYLALVSGKMSAQGTIDVPIKRLEERNMLRVPSQDGQRAITHYETLHIFETVGRCASLVRLRLETGRTHQIRVHCLHVGHPILGDKLYCSEESQSVSHSLGITAQALHAQLLGFVEPLSGKCLEITAKAPFLDSINS
ncbi:MAG: RluA family pseudouridine synthase [Oscillospiraceae bacterium]|nr:RluA family pseudouridine synthase [Oscillospiraceae bacterium]